MIQRDREERQGKERKTGNVQYIIFTMIVNNWAGARSTGR